MGLLTLGLSLRENTTPPSIGTFVAVNDVIVGGVLGQPYLNIEVLANDIGDIDTTTVELVSPTQFLAVDDTITNHSFGTVATANVLANDSGTIDASTVELYENIKREPRASFHAVLGEDNQAFADLENGEVCDMNGSEPVLITGATGSYPVPPSPITPIADTANITVCCVVKLKNGMVTSGTRATNGYSFVANQTSNLYFWSVTNAGSSGITYTNWAAKSENYTFLAYSLQASGYILAYAGFLTPEYKEMSLPREIQPRNISIENGYFTGQPELYGQSNNVAEVVIINEGTSLGEIRDMHIRARERMAKRGIIVD